MNKQNGSERFGLLGVTKRTELISMTIFTGSFWGYLFFAYRWIVRPKKNNCMEKTIEMIEYGSKFFPIALALVLTYETIALYIKSRKDKNEDKMRKAVMEAVNEYHSRGEEDN